MFFRLSVALAYFLYVANIGDALGIGSINAVEKGFFLACAIIYVVKSEIDKTILTLGALVALYTVFVALFVEYPGFSWSILINALNQVVILFLFLSGTPSQRDRQFMLTVAAWAPIGSALFGLAYHLKGIHPMFGQEFASAAIRYQASLIPAFLSGLAMCGAFASMLMLLEKRPKFLWLLLINCVILAAAGGRMPLLVFILTCAGVYLTSPNVTLSKKVLGIYAGLLAGGVLFALFADNLLARFESSGANGRDIMWPYLIALGNVHFWTGIGFGHQFFATPREISIIVGSAASHNDYLRLFVEVGFPGVIIFYSALTYVVFHIWVRRFKCKQHNVIVCYAGILMLMLTDNVLSDVAFFPLLIFGSQPASEFERVYLAPRRYGYIRA